MTTLLEILLVCCMKESGLDTEGGDMSNGKGVWSETCGWRKATGQPKKGR